MTIIAEVDLSGISERKCQILGVPDENKKEKKIEITSIQDIYQHSESLLDVLKRYI